MTLIIIVFVAVISVVDIQRKARYSKQDALNHLAVYPAQWEVIGKNLISPSEVDKIMNNQEAGGDEAAYIIEKWWSITTETEGNFSREKLENAIEKVKENESSHGKIINYTCTSTLKYNLFSQTWVN